MDHPKQGETKILMPGESFARHNVQITFTGEGIAAGWAETQHQIEPFYAELEMTMGEDDKPATVHAFYDPRDLKGVGVHVAHTIDHGPVAVARAMDFEGLVAKPLLINIDNAEPEGVDEKGRVVERTPEDVEIRRDAEGAIEFSVPGEMIPDDIKKRMEGGE